MNIKKLEEKYKKIISGQHDDEEDETDWDQTDLCKFLKTFLLILLSIVWITLCVF